MKLYAEVVLALPLTQVFTYTVPEASREFAKVGSRVLLPFHRREITGFIVGLRQRKKAGKYELKDIREVLDETPIFSAEFLSFARKLSAAFCSSWGEMLQASLPPSYVMKSRVKLSLSEEGILALQSQALPLAEKEVLEILKKGPYTRTFIKSRTKEKNLSAILARFKRKGWVQEWSDVKKSPRRIKEGIDRTPKQLEMDFSLDEELMRAVRLISETLGAREFFSLYLHAPPQKREAVYFELIRKTLNSRRRILFLVPEIAMTSSLQDKFEKKLGQRVALLHSRLTVKQRELEWERIKSGQADVVVGPRSAVLSPLEDIGLVILDEEHDDSYVQGENPSYDARKGALLRAKQSAALYISGSSTPSVEAYFRAKKKGYLIEIKESTERRNVEFLRDGAERVVIGENLIRKMSDRLTGSDPGPILVFSNRRGYAPFMICSRCRYIPRCRRCDVALNLHKKEEKLLCHYCGFSSVDTHSCPECGGRLGPGKNVGIEVVEEELKRRFPAKKIVVFDSDRVQTKKEQERILTLLFEKKIDILAGTQFLAHQEKLQPVSTIVVLCPEIFLAQPDFRASQKTFQSLSQMAKFLSPEKKSILLVQTSNPDHYSIRFGAYDDYMRFYDQEIEYRRLMNYPPFSYLAEILLSGENLRALARESRKIFSLVKELDDGVEAWGPALAPVARIRGKYRVQVVMRSKKKRALDRALCLSLESVKSRKTVYLYD